MNSNYGTLFIVATPIGNLADISARALETLAKVDYILAENPNITKKLLSHYSISVQLKSYREDNHDRVAPAIVEDLKSGKSVALVTDAGTPLVSDPGIKLLREIYANQIPVEPIPGASAVITAMSVFPVPSPKFTFMGFFPRKEQEFIKWFEQTKDFVLKEKVSYVFFESPFRIKATLQALQKLDENVSQSGYNLMVGLAGELTKIHQKIMWANPKSLLEYSDKDFLLDKGEYTIIISFVKDKWKDQ